MIVHTPIAGSVLFNIILNAEFIADLNTDRARASIKARCQRTFLTANVRSRICSSSRFDAPKMVNWDQA